MFIVLEVQTNADGTIGIIPTAFDNEAQTQNKYHTVLAYAAVSDLPKHTAFILTDDGYVIESRCYKHEVAEPEEETNEE